MATKTKTKNTTSDERREARKALATQLQAGITEQVDALRQTERWHQFLTFAASFHQYSLNNVLLILRQMPLATQVAGFRKWQSLGRQVRKGEKAIRIFGYATKKIDTTDEAGPTTTENATKASGSAKLSSHWPTAGSAFSEPCSAIETN